MAPLESTVPAGSTPSWVLPLVATVLVAGSLATWLLIGAFWFASRPMTSQSVLVYVPPGASAEITNRGDATSLRTLLPATEDHADATLR